MVAIYEVLGLSAVRRESRAGEGHGHGHRKENATRYLGVDPGLQGAWALLDASGVVLHVELLPTLTVAGPGRARRVEYDLSQLRIDVGPWRQGPLRAAIEKGHSMPGQGVRSMWTMGYGAGLIEGLLIAWDVPFERIEPQRWQRVMLDGMGKGGDAARVRAGQLFPDVRLTHKKDGRADALLIAEFLRRQNLGGDRPS